MNSAISRFFTCSVVCALAACAIAQTDAGAKPPSSCTSPGLYCNAGVSSASPIRQNNVFVSLGLSPSQETILTNMLGTGNTNNSHITGVLVSVPSGCASSCTPTGPYIDYGGATKSGNYCPSPNFSALDSFVSTVYGANTTNRKLTNIVVAPAGYGINSQTPGGVFSQGWANTLADCSGSALYSLSWASGNYYLPSDYIKDSGGNYWQIKTGAGNSNYTPTNASHSGTTATVTLNTATTLKVNQYVTVTLASPSNASQYNAVEAKITAVSGSQISYALGSAPTWSGPVTAGDVTGDARCIAGTTGGPGPSSTSPYTDGTGNTACTWTKIGTSAPPQDAWVSSSYTGTAGAYELSLNTSGNSCTLSSLTCQVSLSSPYIGSLGDSITVNGVTTSGGTEMNCTGCSVSAITSSTVTYHDSSVTANFSSGINSGAILYAQRAFNSGSVNGSTNLTVLASGLPTPYEPPMKTWIKYICGQVYAHYASDTRVGYIRCGLSEGGEADTDGLTANPGWPFGSQSVFVSYYEDVMADVGSLASSDGLVCMGNLNSFDLPEGQISVSNSCGLGTNGYKVNDVVAIDNSQCLIIGDIQSDWCWNFNQYHGALMPDGRYPILELQTSKTSTPGNDVLGSTGGLAYDNSTCGSYCPWPGLMPVAKTNLANDGEWYMCDFMLAYDSNYSHDGCDASYASYSSAYQTAFAAFAP